MSAHYRIRDISTTVPLDYNQPDQVQINLFAREYIRNNAAPVCVFLQGGPGFESPKDPDAIPWLDFMLDHFRVVFLDQRGTGRSSPVGAELCTALPSAHDQRDYLSQFRADNIVRDLEQLRHQYFGAEPWYLLGQSFGGFISCHYLSTCPEALSGVMICGGLPPMLLSSPAQTYDVLVRTVHQRSEHYYRQYPEDIAKVNQIVSLLNRNPFDLGAGGVMTADRFLDVGMLLGTSSGFSRLHALLDNPFTDTTEQQLRWGFIEQIRQQSSYDTNPIYMLLHEAIYCEGQASQWAAEGAMQRHGGFDAHRKETQETTDTDAGIAFFGETVRRDMTETYSQLRGFKDAAELLAEKSDWPALYNLSQLAENRVPVECIVYEQDYYVDKEQSLRTAAAIKGANVWLHPTWQHDAIRAQGQAVVEPMVKRLLQRVS